MKKLLFLALTGLFFGSHLSSCVPGVDCDAGYTYEFVIKNGTQKKITVSYSERWGNRPALTIEAEKSETVQTTGHLGGCDSKQMMADFFVTETAFPILFPGITITVDGKALPESVWLRKNWSFEPGYYDSTYTLMIDDDLLAELASEQPQTL